MTAISNILFVISNGLLVPIIILLLVLLARAIIMAGGFYSEWRAQKHVVSRLQVLVENFDPDALTDAAATIGKDDRTTVGRCLGNMLTHADDADYCQLALADFHVAARRHLSACRMLIKFGPMLGLMGTLIPMGPALVGLASGDISAMAYNMQVAFSTTVVGMLIAGIGMAILQPRRRFYARAFNLLDFVMHKLSEK